MIVYCRCFIKEQRQEQPAKLSLNFSGFSVLFVPPICFVSQRLAAVRDVTARPESRSVWWGPNAFTPFVSALQTAVQSSVLCVVGITHTHTHTHAHTLVLFQPLREHNSCYHLTESPWPTSLPVCTDGLLKRTELVCLVSHDDVSDRHVGISDVRVASVSDKYVTFL